MKPVLTGIIAALVLGGLMSRARCAEPPVTVVEEASAFTLANGHVTATVSKRSGDLVSLDDDRPRAAPAGEIGDRGADRAAAADHDALSRAHG